MNHRTLISLISVSLIPALAHAQLVIDNSASPDALVQNVLLGGGVTVSNITFNGVAGNSPHAQIAAFNSANANVGIASGLILATGDASVAMGPNNSGSTSLELADNASDADLAQITGTLINDAAVLEFDFVPTGGQVSFNFVFASEEYPEFVDLINDAFGFFLSGPGISGPYANNAANIALLPGTATPVTINTVNGFVNAGSFVDNGDGFTAPYNTSAQYIQYDGFTVPLNATAQVQCGQQYHIKLAIGDATDRLYDSAVFLEAGAFASPAASLTLTPDPQVPCLGQVDLSVLNVQGGSGPFNYQWSLQGNVLSSTQNVTATADATQYYVAQVTDACGGVAIDSVLVSPMPMLLDVPAQLSVPCMQQGSLSMVLQQMGAGPYSYTWSSNGTILGNTMDLTVPAPAQPTWFVAMASDACGVQANDSVLVTMVAPQITVVASADVVLPCDAIGTVLSVVSVNGGTGPFVYEWTSGGNVLGSLQTLDVSANAATYMVTVSDACGSTASATESVSTQEYPPVIVTATADVTVTCTGDTAQASMVSVEGGVGPYTYSWMNADGVVISSATYIEVAVPTDLQFTLTATDVCGHVGSTIVNTLAPNYGPLAIHLMDRAICVGGGAVLIPTVSGGAGSCTFYWIGSAVTDSSLTVSPEAPTNYAVQVTDFCGQIATDQATVTIEHPTVHILGSPNGNEGWAFEATAQPTPQTYAWDLGDGHTDDGQRVTYSFGDAGEHLVQVTMTTMNGCVATDSLLIPSISHLYLPNAFTPDGDGINDVFGVVGNDLSTFEMTIFDRWGSEVFAMSAPDQVWDGRMQNGQMAPTGVYVYTYRASGERLPMTDGLGHVTLLGQDTAQD